MAPSESDSESEHQEIPARGTSAQLLPHVYEELRRLARQNVHAECGTQTLTATALVHEAWLRLSKVDNPLWEDRRHFFNAAAQAMRWILVDRARKRQCQKRGKGAEHVELEDSQIQAPADDEELLAINESLTRLAVVDQQAAELIHLRYYAGLKWSEMAELTGMTERELTRHCDYARAWLRADFAK